MERATNLMELKERVDCKEKVEDIGSSIKSCLIKLRTKCKKDEDDLAG